jgi:hypothetical protein
MKDGKTSPVANTPDFTSDKTDQQYETRHENAVLPVQHRNMQQNAIQTLNNPLNDLLTDQRAPKRSSTAVGLLFLVLLAALLESLDSLDLGG